MIQTLKNESLYSSCKEYCKTALDSIRQVITSRQEQSVNLLKKTGSIDSRDLSVPVDPNIDLLFFVLRNEDTLKKTYAYQTAIQALGKDKIIAEHLNKLVGTEESRSRIDAESCLRSLLIGLLREQKSLDFQESIFDDVKLKSTIRWIVTYILLYEK